MPTETGWRAAFAPRNLLLVGLAGCAIALLGIVFASEAALRAWLAATFLWTGVPIGALGLLMMMRLIPGVWDDELMLPIEAATLLMPLAALAILPVLLGIPVLYAWSAKEQETAFRLIYLSEKFFVLRTVLGFAVLGLLTFLLLARRGWSAATSSVGLIAYTPLVSLLSMDWLMSLDPEFYSSGFGLYALSIQMTVAMAVAVALAVLSGSRLARPGVLGNLVLSALLAWAYFAFMPFFIIWSGDLPEGVLWYQRRAAGAWVAVLWVISLLHAVPMALLLFPTVRRNRRALVGIAMAIVAGKALEVAWLVLPADGVSTGWAAAVLLVPALIGVGAIFSAAYVRAFRARVEHRTPHASPREDVS